MRKVERSNKLEREVETPFAEWITANEPDYLCVKLFKRRGLPDRLVIGPDRFVLFVEFKRPGARKGRRGEKLQNYFANLIRGFGFTYVKTDTKASAIEAFQRERIRTA